jgi:hypothetical protein
VILLAVDPGNELSALVVYDASALRVVEKMKIPNIEALDYLIHNRGGAERLTIEMAESFGAKVWSQVFTTVLWTGRFVQAWGRPFTLVTRREVKLQLAGSPRAKDGQIRNVLIDRWGGKETAIGKKAAPGPLFGVTADCWQALAIAVTYADGVKLRAA